MGILSLNSYQKGNGLQRDEFSSFLSRFAPHTYSVRVVGVESGLRQSQRLASLQICFAQIWLPRATKLPSQGSLFWS